MKKEEIIRKITEHSILIKDTREDVRAIKENHIPHLDHKVNWILGLIITAILAMAGTFISLIILLLK